MNRMATGVAQPRRCGHSAWQSLHAVATAMPMRHYKRALRRFLEIGDRYFIGACLIGLAHSRPGDRWLARGGQLTGGWLGRHGDHGSAAVAQYPAIH